MGRETGYVHRTVSSAKCQGFEIRHFHWNVTLSFASRETLSYTLILTPSPFQQPRNKGLEKEYTCRTFHSYKASQPGFKTRFSCLARLFGLAHGIILFPSPPAPQGQESQSLTQSPRCPGTAGSPLPISQLRASPLPHFPHRKCFIGI